MWEPSKDSWICSRHSVHGEPTLVNPNPTRLWVVTTILVEVCYVLHLLERESVLRNKDNFFLSFDKTQTKEASKGNIPDTETFDDELEMNETVDFDLFDLEKSLETDITDNINTRNQENTLSFKYIIISYTT